MRVSGRALVIVLVGLSNVSLFPFPAAAQQADEVVTAQVLGPQWKQISRRAGMIFAGTLLSTATQGDTTPATGAVPGPIPTIQLTFRVDEAIAGVEPGRTVTIVEWAGAWNMQRPMTQGEHILLFLYPPSRLGLTSPVGGSRGQVALDQTGESVSRAVLEPATAIARRSAGAKFQVTATDAPGILSPVKVSPISISLVSVAQLKRAIRSARNEQGRP
jgi:hypothetical protein